MLYPQLLEAVAAFVRTDIVFTVEAAYWAQGNSIGSDGPAPEGLKRIGAGGVIAAVAAIVAAMARSGKMAPKTAALAVAVIAIVALVVSRYGFYMASVI